MTNNRALVSAVVAVWNEFLLRWGSGDLEIDGCIIGYLIFDIWSHQTSNLESRVTKGTALLIEFWNKRLFLMVVT